MSVAAIILAAGAATRFGSLKQLAEVEGVPLVARAVAAASGVAVLDPVVLVVGAEGERVAAAVPEGRHRTVTCEDWADGLSASLRSGIVGAGPVDAAMILLADQPLVSSALVRRVLADGMPALAKGIHDAARPVWEGRPGHPVLLGWRGLSRHRELRGDVGISSLLEPERILLLRSLDESPVIDVDYPRDLRLASNIAAQRAAAARRKSEQAV
ncbi:MAG: NTP transferase domain-containing protein [Solirubrobacteraceae bacterium]|nr:NTP transferase domain-containing protein [Solirubrobacteraceae bacterium]